jgi:glycosyltransferase 2 family protein
MKNWRFWLGLGISAASILFLIRTVDLPALGAALAGANLLLVVACFATVPVSMYLKAYRWRLFFPEPGRLSMPGLLRGLYIGYTVNAVAPLRAGEVVRAFLVGESERVSTSTVIATVVIEKILDVGTMALFLFLLRFVIALPDWAEAAALLSGVGLLAAILGLGAALAVQGPAIRLVAALEARVPPLRRLRPTALLESFLDGLAFARDARLLLIVVLWSVIMWLASALTIYLGLGALGIWEDPSVALFVLVVTNLGMAVPSAPGYVGVFHSAVLVALEPFGVDASRALAAAIVLHATIFGAIILGGVYYLAAARRKAPADGGIGGLVARARSATHEAH